jgi:TnpA family transposase
MAINILNPEERRQLSTIPLEISEAELVRFFTLTPPDIALINPFAQPTHRLDQAAHICLLRWLGWSPDGVDRLPHRALVALCEQLGLSIPSGDLEPPPTRTSRQHAQRAREHLGWRKYTAELEPSLKGWLKPLAAEYDHGPPLLEALLRHLYQQKIVRPGLTRLERLVGTIRATVKTELAQTINSQLSPEQKKQLDNLVTVPAGEVQSPFQHLKETPAHASGPELLTVLDRIETIRAMGLDRVDLSQVHPNRVKLLAQRAKRRTNWMTAQFKPAQRYPLLVCFLDQAWPTLIDVAVRMHGDIIQGIFRRAETRRNTVIMQHGQRLNDKVLLLARLARLVLDEENIPNADLRTAIYGCVPRDRLANTIRECDELAQPADYAPFTFAARSYAYLRRFGPSFLRTVHFEAEEADHPLLEAVKFMQAVNNGQRSFEDPPLKFVPWPWKSYVVDDKEQVKRPMYELCLHDRLAKAVDRGELWVSGSQAYTSFRDDWIADEAWPAARAKFLNQFPELADVDVFLKRARTTLDEQMTAANRLWPDLQDEVWIKEGTLHLARLEARVLPAGVARLQERLTDLFPRPGIAQLLLEVNHWVGVDQLLTNLNPQQQPTENLTAKKLAVILAEGLNIGLKNMSYCVPTMSYADLAGVYDRYVREETLRQALVAVVNFYHRLPVTRSWGEGTASSSDGQLFGVPIRTVHAQYHPKSPSKSGRAVSVYTHVSDHGMPFYGRVIHDLSQEGAYVLDGLLYHETDLTPQRHFVDTGGYQDTLWGACHLLGFSLEPRIRDIGDMRLFRMRRNVDQFQHLRDLFSAPINTRAIRENWDDVLRLMASIYTGVVPASRVLSKLNAYHVETGLYKALREIGRIAKTSFLLDYFTQRPVRRRVQRGLNLQESIHALARALFIGQRGELRLRDLNAQLHRISCLQLVMAMVITWNAAYLSAAVDKLKAEGVTITDEQLAHILPVLSEHINLLGNYEFEANTTSVQTDVSALPLRLTRHSRD